MTMIRKATSEDLNPLSILFNAYRVFYQMDSGISEAAAFLEERIAKNESQIFVAEDAMNNLVGFVQLYPLFSSKRMKRLWLLNDLFVEPSQRGQGISKKLIQHAKELCLESNSCGMILETAKSNVIGNQLYPTTGFKQDNDHNYYFWDC